MSRRTWVKICGVTRVEDALAAADAGADAIGINFWKGSRRFCATDRAREIRDAVVGRVLVFGVFVRAARAEMEETVAAVGLDGVQLHGGEPLSESEGWDLPVIRAVGAGDRDTVAAALAAATCREAAPAANRRPVLPPRRWSGHRLLLDHASGGGSGELVAGDVLEGFDLSTAIVAGGLTARNVAAIVRRLSPFGVDVAGGVESAAGVKDAAEVAAFVRAATGVAAFEGAARRGDGD